MSRINGRRGRRHRGPTQLVTVHSVLRFLSMMKILITRGISFPTVMVSVIPSLFTITIICLILVTIAATIAWTIVKTAAFMTAMVARSLLGEHF
jgi:hypothetical protein